MVLYCIVKNCHSNSNKCSGVSFFQLPKDKIMREAWLRRIGDCKPHNEKSAKVCSLHFSEDSLIVPKRKSKIAKNKKILHLLRSAVPTLFSTPTEDKYNFRTNTMENMNLKIIRREFTLVCNPGTNRDVVDKNVKSSSGIDAVSPCSNVTSMVENPSTMVICNDSNKTNSIAVTPTVCSTSNPWLNESYRVTRTLPSALHTLKTDFSKTFPRRSLRCMPYTYHRRTSASRKHEYRDKVHSKRSITPERAVTCHSMENTPLSTCTQRFFMEDCNESINSSGPKPTEIYNLQADVTSLKAELHHYRLLHEFHMQSNSMHSTKLTSVELENEALKQQLENISAKNKEMLQKINDLQVQLTSTTAINNATVEDDREKYFTKRVEELLKPYLTQGQIRCILQKKKWIHWSIDDYAAAISLRSVSPKAYRFLQVKLNFPLPSLASLRRWALKKFNIEEGFLTDVLALMREKGKQMSSLEKVAVLSFDEMAVSSEVNFDDKLEKLVGPHGEVQLMMARGIFSNWKQPIYYKFDQPMNQYILLEAITLLHNADYQVIAIVSDMGNRGIWRELDISPKKYFFNHPVKEEEKIFVFADVPHLLKLLRNWFFDAGFSLGNSNERFTRAVYQTLVDMSSANDLHVAHRVTQQLLDVRGSQRQSVKLAARIWSNTAAEAIKWAGEHKLLECSEYLKFSDFVSTVNKWFDVHNSQSKYGSHLGVNGYGQALGEQNSNLLLMSTYIENMRVGSRKELMPFQKGILVSNLSLRGLFEYLQKKYPQECEYIITRRLQQENVLENFFSFIRAMDSIKDHPSSYDFRCKLRWYILGKHAHVFTMNKNTEEDMDASCITSSNIDKMNRNAEKPSMISVTPTTSTAKANIVTSTPSPGMGLFASQSNDSLLQEGKKLESIEEHDEIILTRELFSNIVNISPEELQEANDYDDKESMTDTYFGNIDDDELFEIVTNGFIKDSSDRLNLVEEAGLEYLAGFIAYKFRAKYPSLGTTEDAGGTIIKWIETVSKGYLTNPSAELVNVTKIVEKYFVQFHGDYFSKNSFVIKKVVQLVENSGEYLNEVPHEVLQYIVKSRTYIRVREINRRTYAINNAKKMKKITSAAVPKL